VIVGGLLVATVITLGVVPPIEVLVRGLEASWLPQRAAEGLIR
jgi:hypothetical protein